MSAAELTPLATPEDSPPSAIPANITNSSTTKRARACTACHSIKIKCELGSRGGPPPCSRCVRLGKTCLVTPPKRQKDRVADLEAQVEALTKMLEKQGMNGSGDQNSDVNAESVSKSAERSAGDKGVPQQKKRRLEDEASQGACDEVDMYISAVDGIELDTVISREQQQRIFHRYASVTVPSFPLIPTPPGCGYTELRKTRPILLQAMMFVASADVLPQAELDEIGKVVKDLISNKAMSMEDKPIDLVQAIQLYVMWYRTTKYETSFGPWQLVAVSEAIADDLRITGQELSHSTSFEVHGIESGEVWRTRLITHLLAASVSIYNRKPTSRPWGQLDQHGLEMLEYSQISLPSDRLFCQYIRGEHLCEEIANRSDFSEFPPTLLPSDPISVSTRQTLGNLITDWKAQIPPRLHYPGVLFWGHVATMYLHEHVLHTATNRKSFEAPYLAERLSVTEFPAPMVSQEHIASIEALKDGAHQVLTTFADMDIATMINLPAMFYAARVAYCEFILLKLYIATTAFGNTYGAYIDPQTFQVEDYLQKMLNLAVQVVQIDPKCPSARILMATSRMQEWVQNYKRTQLGHLNSAPDLGSVGSNGGQGGGVGMSACPDMSAFPEAGLTNWNDLSLDEDPFGYGLAEIFADPAMSTFMAESLGDGETVAPSMLRNIT